MTLEEMKKKLYYDEILYIKNPYFYIRDYEDKGAIVVIKKEKDIDLHYQQLENVCFECPDLEYHDGIIRMLVFSMGDQNEIKSYRVASSKFKILRSDILQYEKMIGKIIEVV